MPAQLFLSFKVSRASYWRNAETAYRQFELPAKLAPDQKHANQHARNVTQPSPVRWQVALLGSIESKHEQRIVDCQNRQETNTESRGVVRCLHSQGDGNPDHCKCQTTKPVCPSSMRHNVQPRQTLARRILSLNSGVPIRIIQP